MRACFLLFLVLLLLPAGRLAAQGDQNRQDVSDEDDDDEDDATSSSADGAAPPSFATDQAVPDARRPRFVRPQVPTEGVYYAQYFPGPARGLAQHGLVASSAAKYDGVWLVEAPTGAGLDGDLVLTMKSPARHHAVAGRLRRPLAFDRRDRQFVLQYEVRFQNGMECGGGYVKLLTAGADLNLTNLTDQTPYTIMFGPDKCGPEHRLHFILRHRSPATGRVEEKHAKQPTADLSAYFSDHRTHLYTLLINSDNSFEIHIDRMLVSAGSLLTDMQPPINPPREVDDPSDTRPADWDDRAQIPDPQAGPKPTNWDESQPEMVEDTSAVMPSGWLPDQPLTLPDPAARRPLDWDDSLRGAWEPPRIDNPRCKSAPGCGPWSRPMVKNPRYKGKWTPPLVANPAFKGPWQPRKIPNPDFYEDLEPWRFAPIGAIGFELWTTTENVAFDNLLLADSKAVADAFADQTWPAKRRAERLSDSVLQWAADAVRAATRDRPWIWAALLVCVVLPAVLLVTYCCCLGESHASPPAPRRRRLRGAGDDDDVYEGQPYGEGSGDDAEEEEEGEAGDEGDAAQLLEEDSDEPPELIELDAPELPFEADGAGEPTGGQDATGADWTGARRRTVGRKDSD